MRIEGFQDVISYLEPECSFCRMMLPICRLKTGEKAMLSKIVMYLNRCKFLSYFTQEGDVCNWSIT